MTGGPAAGGLPAALLFDMDGLLVDTEGTWYVVEAEVMAELGGPWDEEHQLALFGGPLEKSARLHARPGRPARRQRRPGGAGTGRRHGPPPRQRAGRLAPGAEALLTAAAAAGVPCALVSSSLRPVVDAVLDAVGRQHFAATVSGDDVVRTKPHPDPYLLAAELLGVDPAGLRRARGLGRRRHLGPAAGCSHGRGPQPAPGADDLFDLGGRRSPSWTWTASPGCRSREGEEEGGTGRSENMRERR